MPATNNPVAELVELILDEGPIGMSAAAKLYGTFRNGKAPHPSTPTRHATHGVRLADGSVVRLAAVRVSGRLVTSRERVVEFIASQQRACEPPPIQTPAARLCADAEARKILDSAGIR